MSISQSSGQQKQTKKQRIKLYTPHDKQVLLHNSSARFRFATCGRRWGKTLAGVNEIAKAAWEFPGCMTWWVAPVYRQALIPYRTMTSNFNTAFKSPPRLSDLTVTWKNGSMTQFLSAEKFDNLRGDGVKFLVIDEAAKVRKAAWQEALRPTLSDTNGRALIIGTPFGRNWFYHEHLRGNDPLYPEYESFKFPTISNPYIPDSEVEFARQTLPSDVFQQEYEADFLEDGAGVFRGIRQCIKGELQEPVPGRQYVIGWDIAKHTDFSVFVVIDVGTAQIVAFERFNQIDYSVQVGRLKDLANRYNGASVLMDSTGVGDPVLEQVKAADVDVDGYSFTNTTKQQLIEHLVVCIEKKEIEYPDIAVMINELELYQYEMTRAGNVRYNAPDGYHDDCVISLALAAWKLKHNYQSMFIAVA